MVTGEFTEVGCVAKGIPMPRERERPGTHKFQQGEKTTMHSAAVPIRQTEDSIGSAVIGRSVTIKGQIISREDLTIDGEVEGSVELREHRLTVGPSGKLQADVRAREIVVLGSIQGNVQATEKIEIKRQASINGDIRAARVVTEDGAYLKGSVDTSGAAPDPVSRPGSAIPIR